MTFLLAAIPLLAHECHAVRADTDRAGSVSSRPSPTYDLLSGEGSWMAARPERAAVRSSLPLRGERGASADRLRAPCPPDSPIRRAAATPLSRAYDVAVLPAAGAVRRPLPWRPSVVLLILHQLAAS